MKIRMIGALFAVATLAACATPPADTANTAGGGSGSSASTASGVVPGSEEDLVATAGDRVFFDTNVSSLTSDDRATLDRQAAWLAKYPSVSVQVAGNCDERGTEEYNIALGQRRANSARDYLVAKGTDSARITTISYGKDRPVALGSTPEDWKQNRNAITSVR